MLIETAAFVLVFSFGVFLMTLAGLLVFAEERGKSFLLGFASSAFTHFLEIGLRILVGASLVIISPKMYAGQVFFVFGWMLIGTSAVLAFVPWRLHQRFGQTSLPPILKYPKLLAIFSAALGLFLIFGLMIGPTVER